MVVQIKSPSNTGRKLRKKVSLYLDHGAQQVWIVQPRSRDVVVLTPDDDVRIAGGDGSVKFDSLVLPVGSIFRV